MFSCFIHWLEAHQMPCVYKKYLGMDCPGCGMQRGIIELLKGNLWESIQAYPPLIPMLLMMLYLLLHIKFKFKNGALYLKILFIFTSVIIVTNYIIKLIINH